MAHWRGAEQQPGDDSASHRSTLWSVLEWPRQRPSPQGKFLDSHSQFTGNLFPAIKRSAVNRSVALLVIP
ncbi:hypothetical protein TYRP_017534 [Tyrophagus putrescentiae]|nr:hypothetical protein TYRP_017534 [Tyrophagus putrescentiae]